jgi:hypothetical protein
MRPHSIRHEHKAQAREDAKRDFKSILIALLIILWSLTMYYWGAINTAANQDKQGKEVRR